MLTEPIRARCPRGAVARSRGVEAGRAADAVVDELEAAGERRPTGQRRVLAGAGVLDRRAPRRRRRRGPPPRDAPPGASPAPPGSGAEPRSLTSVAGAAMRSASSVPSPIAPPPITSARSSRLRHAGEHRVEAARRAARRAPPPRRSAPRGPGAAGVACASIAVGPAPGEVAAEPDQHPRRKRPLGGAQAERGGPGAAGRAGVEPAHRARDDRVEHHALPDLHAGRRRRPPRPSPRPRGRGSPGRS